jgi:hypothetical protein
MNMPIRPNIRLRRAAPLLFSATATSRHGKQYATMDRQSQGAFCAGLREILHRFRGRLADTRRSGREWLYFQGSAKKWPTIFLHREAPI